LVAKVATSRYIAEPKYPIDLISKIKLEILAENKDVDSVINTIVKAASTGSIGDGKVWATPVDNVVRVRTGEKGEAAI